MEPRKKTTSALILSLAALALAACQSPNRITAGDIELTNGRTVRVPATAEASKTGGKINIPEGTPVEIKPDGALAFTPAALTEYTFATEAHHATTATDYEPPAPPSPTDKAAGRALLWMRLGLVAGIAAGLFGLIRGWDMVAIGGGAIAAACLIGQTLAAIPTWLWLILGAGAALAIAGPSLWHLKLKHTTAPTPAAA